MKTSTPIGSTVLLLLAVTSEVVWSYTSMHLGLFAAPETSGNMPVEATIAFYGGYVIVAALMVMRPRLFGPLVPSTTNCALMMAVMIASSVLWSFSYGQTLFDPFGVLVAGALLSGLSGAFAISVVYPAVYAILNPNLAMVVVMVAHLCKRLAVPAINALGMGVNVLLLVYMLPVVTACLLWVVVRGRRAAFRPIGSTRPPATLWLLLVATGLAMTIADEGGTGVWSLAAETARKNAIELLVVAALVLGSIAGLRWLSRFPVWTRFLLALIIAIAPALLMDDYSVAAFCATDASQTFFHGAAWVITFAGARECRVEVRRAMGVVFVAQTISALMLNLFSDSSILPWLVLLVLVVVIFCAVVAPSVWGISNQSSAVSPADHVDDSLRNVLNTRCRQIAYAYDLSEREYDVMCLLVEGWPRQVICASLSISEGTVKTHASHIYAKLGIQSRQDLAQVVFGEPGYAPQDC